MKKLIVILIITVLVFIGYSYNQYLWGNKLGEPTTYTIKKGEYLSKIARDHYGNASYWQELALINRAPNSDLIAPGEVIILPSPEVMKKIRQTRWLSRVNAFLQDDEEILALLNQRTEPAAAPQEQQSVPTVSEDARQPQAVPADPAAKPEDTRTNSLFMPLAIFGVIFLIALVAFVLLRRKKQAEATKMADNGHTSRKQTSKDTEPDYNEYLRKKKHSEVTYN